MKPAPQTRVDWTRLSLFAAVLAAECLLFPLAFPRSRLPHEYSRYALLWLGRTGAYGEFGAAPGILVFGASLIALMKGPPAWTRSLTQPASAEERKRLAGAFLLAHGVSLAGFVLLSTSLLAHPVGSGEGIAPRAALLLWPALAGLAAACFLLGAWAAVGPNLPPAACFLAPSLLAGVVADDALSAAHATIGPFLVRSTLSATHRLLGLLFERTVYDPARLLIGTTAFSVVLMKACSGSEGIALISLFCCLFWLILRDRLSFPRAFLLLPLGIAAQWTLNVLRVAALIAIGSEGHGKFALGLFHSSAGWLAFIATALALAGACARFSALGGGFMSSSPASGEDLPYLLPLLTALALIFLTGDAPDTNGRFAIFVYPLRALITGAVLACFWTRYRDIIRWSFCWPAAGIGALVFVLWAAAGAWRGGDSATPLISEALGRMSFGRRISWIAFRAVGSILIAPLAEELAFRGYLGRWLVDSDFERVPLGRWTVFSLAVSSLAFGLLHASWLLGTIAGMLFAAAAIRRGLLSDAVVAHATANALLTAFVLATGNWGLWT